MSRAEFLAVLAKIAARTQNWDRVEFFIGIVNPADDLVLTKGDCCPVHLARIAKAAVSEVSDVLKVVNNAAVETLTQEVEDKFQEDFLRSLPPELPGEKGN